MVIYSLISSATYLIFGLSFSVIYKTVRFFNFAHGVVFTSGAYFTLLLKNWFNLPIFIATPFAIIFSTLLGCLLELSLYRPLRRKNASSMILLLTSLGVYIVLQNIISIIFGDDTKSIRSGIVQEGINIFSARITPIQIAIICTSIVLVILVAILLYKTKIGKAMRAVANDPELADISGIDSDRIILWTFAIGSALAGFAGILVSLDVDMTPTMGMNALMMGVIVVIIGGIGSIPGVVFGALLLGLVQHFGIWKIGSQWQDAIAFITLLVFLLFRPQGFMGKKVKKAEV